MILDKEQLEKFEEAVRPLMEWLSENCHPRVKVIVDLSTAEVLEGSANFLTDDYVQD